jgi:hypothetical protein
MRKGYQSKVGGGGPSGRMQQIWNYLKMDQNFSWKALSEGTILGRSESGPESNIELDLLEINRPLLLMVS